MAGGGTSGPRPAFAAELPTDPGRRDPFESLYRSSEPTDGPLLPTPRHFESTMHPPEESTGNYDWLFRADETEAEDSAEPESVIPVETVGAAEPMVAERAAQVPTGPAPVAPPSDRPRRRWLPLVLIACLVMAVLGAGAGWWLSRPTAPVSAPAPVGSASVVPPAPVEPSPSVVPAAPVRPDSVTVSCEAKPEVDDGGRKVSYGAANLVDAGLDTAWRCPGSGVDEKITFHFAEPVTLDGLGLVNGYAKVDPTSGKHRYPEYRRVTDVTWSFPDGSVFPQALSDEDPDLQTLPISARTTSEVVLTIIDTSEPGSKAGSRNAVLISEVTFGAVG